MMFIEKGHGGTIDYNIVRDDFSSVRKMFNDDASSSLRSTGSVVLQETQARIVAERAESRARHPSSPVMGTMGAVDRKLLRCPGRPSR